VSAIRANRKAFVELLKTGKTSLHVIAPSPHNRSNRYIVGEVVGAGGFGIVYKAWDTKLETIVAVKEFFISRLVTRAEGLKNVIISKNSKSHNGTNMNLLEPISMISFALIILVSKTSSLLRYVRPLPSPG